MRNVHSLGRALAVVLVGFLATASLTGCGKHLASCKQSDKDYVGAKELPPLKAPDGLETPDTRNALKVPVLDTPERIRGRDEPCLDSPPPFGSSKAVPAAPAPPPAKPREVPTQ